MALHDPLVARAIENRPGLHERPCIRRPHRLGAGLAFGRRNLVRQAPPLDASLGPSSRTPRRTECRAWTPASWLRRSPPHPRRAVVSPPPPLAVAVLPAPSARRARGRSPP